MSQSHEHHPNDLRACGPREALPGDFEPALHAMDDRLARLARGVEPPTGLETRVFEASVAGLGMRLRPADTRRRRRLAPVVLRTTLGRLAMAACLAVAFVLAPSVLQPPTASETTVASADDMGWLFDEPLEEVDRDVAHLLDTAAISASELTGELESLIAALEM
jgi:hypothetical protein